MRFEETEQISEPESDVAEDVGMVTLGIQNNYGWYGKNSTR